MTFLNPFVLFGLTASAIPLILHLLNQRKLRTIEFSSLRFLKELQRTSMRRVRFRQILLLILRTLIIACLVLAYSRPALRTSLAGFGGTEATSTVVLLLDDSPSMTVRDERGSAFSRGVQRAEQIAASVGERDKVFVLPLSGATPNVPLPAPFFPGGAGDQLTRLAPSYASVPLGDALRRAHEIFAQSNDANKEVVVITDGQATQFRPTQHRPDSSSGWGNSARLFLLMTPSGRNDNTGVTGANVATRIVTEHNPVRLLTHIGNFGSTPVRGTVASAYLNGSRVGQRTIDVAVHGTVDPTFQFTPNGRGRMGGYVEIEDDIFDQDNRRYFTLDVPERIRVLLVGANAAATHFPSLALSLAGDSSLAGQFSPQRITEAELPSADLDRYDVVLLSGLRGPSAASARRLSRFVRSGGGLLIYPGPETVPALYNESLFPELGIPRLTGGPMEQPKGSFLTFGTIDFDHPVFEGMFDATQGLRRKKPEIESPHILSSLVLTIGGRGETIIGLSNGTTFLAEYPAGDGKVIVCSVEAGLTWSDFPVKGLFAPLLHRSLLYLAEHGEQQNTVLAGTPLRFTVRLREFSDREFYSVSDPAGVSRRVIPRFPTSTGVAVFEAGTAAVPGVYALMRERQENSPSSQTIRTAAVNLDPAESDLRTVTDDELAVFWHAEGIPPDNVRRIAPDDSPMESLRRARFGTELWKHCVVLTIILALAEMAVGRIPKQSIGEVHPS